ncbi:MAG: hypothetical protein ACJAY7_001839 [Pseudohongiellaceae bacterium]|jgi:hypothetical protein
MAVLDAGAELLKECFLSNRPPKTKAAQEEKLALFSLAARVAWPPKIYVFIGLYNHRDGMMLCRKNEVNCYLVNIPARSTSFLIKYY